MRLGECRKGEVVKVACDKDHYAISSGNVGHIVGLQEQGCMILVLVSWATGETSLEDAANLSLLDSQYC